MTKKRFIELEPSERIWVRVVEWDIEDRTYDDDFIEFAMESVLEAYSWMMRHLAMKDDIFPKENYVYAVIENTEAGDEYETVLRVDEDGCDTEFLAQDLVEGRIK